MIALWEIFQIVFNAHCICGGGIMLKKFLRIKFVTLGYQDILMNLEE